MYESREGKFEVFDYEEEEILEGLVKSCDFEGFKKYLESQDFETDGFFNSSMNIIEFVANIWGERPKEDRSKFIEFLLEKGAKPEQTCAYCNEGGGPLFNVCEVGTAPLDLIKKMVEAGAPVDDYSILDLKNAMQISLEKLRHDIFGYLLSKGGRVDYPYCGENRKDVRDD